MDKQQLDHLINDLAQTGINLTYMLRYATLSTAQKAQLQARVQHQQDVIKVMLVLPGRHRYEQVEAAINAAGVSPSSIYESLAANTNTLTLARFYEALNESGSTHNEV